MGYSSSRNEYNANFSKEHYTKTNAMMTLEDHAKVTKIARENGLSNSELIKLGIKLLESGELKTFVEEATSNLHRRSKNGTLKSQKSFSMQFKKDEFNEIANKVRKTFGLSYGVVAKATALYLESKKDC